MHHSGSKKLQLTSFNLNYSRYASSKQKKGKEVINIWKKIADQAHMMTLVPCGSTESSDKTTSVFPTKAKVSHGT